MVLKAQSLIVLLLLYSLSSQSSGCYMHRPTTTTTEKAELDDTKKEPCRGTLLILLLAALSANARISVMYAHDKLSDVVAEQCFNEMFPRKHIVVQESDESCIIFCVLKKLGIMSPNGAINLDVYRKRVQVAHNLDQRNLVSDFGSSCVESAEATQHKQDVCKKAKVFNDCTHLYKILLK